MLLKKCTARATRAPGARSIGGFSTHDFDLSGNRFQQHLAPARRARQNQRGKMRGRGIMFSLYRVASIHATKKSRIYWEGCGACLR